MPNGPHPSREGAIEAADAYIDEHIKELKS